MLENDTGWQLSFESGGQLRRVYRKSYLWWPKFQDGGGFLFEVVRFVSCFLLWVIFGVDHRKNGGRG